jgi:kinesin family protein C1
MDLESNKIQLDAKIAALQIDLDTTRQRLTTANTSLDDDRREYRREVDNLSREHRNTTDQMRRDMTDESERLMRKHQDELRDCQREMDQLRRDLGDDKDKLERAHREELHELQRKNDQELDDERRARIQDVQNIKAQIAVEQQNLDVAVGTKDRQIQNMRGQLEELQGELDREQTMKGNLQKSLSDSLAANTMLKTEIQKLEAHIEFLKSDVKGQSDKFVDLERELDNARTSEQKAWGSVDDIKAKLIVEETRRRILFNQVQELKGNIRVMCRVRPISTTENVDVAKIVYPDVDKESKELEVQGPEEKSSLGNITRKNNAFSFDRVFGPSAKNEEVFEEISQLVQSALDGYNVCIFCYGQTGAGKTYTMSSADGMIPRATHQIYDNAIKLQDKGWIYAIEGSFVEVYNEDIHDLLGNPKEFDKKKHEIRHDDVKKQTTVTGLKSIPLDSPDAVESMLKRADANRSVAATKSNERSSRSHSVFILKLMGKNSTTGETSEGTLNLVDLAGSERLKSSGAEGDRMKETQNINKSLSCLSDVIGALGTGKEGAHIPYRNSKVCSHRCLHA